MAKARPMDLRDDGVARIALTMGDTEWVLTRAEWGGIAQAAREAFDAQRVKCAGCRCHILPGDTCSCCADTGTLDPDELAI